MLRKYNIFKYQYNPGVTMDIGGIRCDDYDSNGNCNPNYKLFMNIMSSGNQVFLGGSFESRPHVIGSEWLKIIKYPDGSEDWFETLAKNIIYSYIDVANVASPYYDMNGTYEDGTGLLVFMRAQRINLDYYYPFTSTYAINLQSGDFMLYLSKGTTSFTSSAYQSYQAIPAAGLVRLKKNFKVYYLNNIKHLQNYYIN